MVMTSPPVCRPGSRPVVVGMPGGPGTDSHTSIPASTDRAKSASPVPGRLLGTPPTASPPHLTGRRGLSPPAGTVVGRGGVGAGAPRAPAAPGFPLAGTAWLEYEPAWLSPDEA